MLSDSLHIQGDVSLRLIDSMTQKVRSQVHVQNLITTLGKRHFIDRIVGNSSDILFRIQIGDGLTTPTVNDTSLAGNTLESLIRFLNRPTDADNYLIAEAVFLDTPENTPNFTINEVGLFTSTFDLAARTVLPNGITKNETDILSVIWKIQLG